MISALLIIFWVLMAGCAQHQFRKVMRVNLPPSGSTQLLAVYMPWFGDHSHINVGYSSHDPAILQRQIQEARDLGISGFIVDWYGDRQPFLDTTFRLLQRVARQNHFHVALMYNETADDIGNATEEALASLSEAYKSYIGPNAPDREAYLTYNGRPVIVIFPKQGRTDWNIVREQVNRWETPPLLFYKDEAASQFDGAFDGYYAWVHPGNKGWSADGSDWGKQYLEDFYRSMKQKHSAKIAMGAAWPGFDDRSAPWSLNRHMDSRCGKTLEETLQLYHGFYDDAAPLPFLLVETWNDYEEGTAIEHRRAADCPARG